MKPLLASSEVAGFPITSLEKGIPDEAIWNNADLGHVWDEENSRPSQVVYSVSPSVSLVSKTCFPMLAVRTIVELDAQGS